MGIDLVSSFLCPRASCRGCQRSHQSASVCKPACCNYRQWRAVKRSASPLTIPHPTAIRANGQQTTTQLLHLSNQTNIPIFDTQKCTRSSSLAAECKFYGGGAGGLGLLAALNNPQPDLILLLGARTGMFLGGRSGAIIPPHEKCKLIHVDVDGGEIGRTLPVDLGVISDVGQFVAALNAQLPEIPIDKNWVNTAITLQSLPSPYENDAPTNASGHMHPYHALKAFFASLRDHTPILVTDGGECALWAGAVSHLASPSATLKSTGALGFLGNGFGYALGAAVAAPHKKVVNLHGDGSAGFHFMELDTYARLGLDVLTVVVNNYCWGMSSNGQELIYGEENPARPVSALSAVAGYDAVSRGLGNRGVKVLKVQDVEGAVQVAVSGKGPACVELVVDSKPIHPVTEMMVGRTEDPNLVVVPYYDNIPRAYYKD